MSCPQIRIARFGGPEVLELLEQATIPDSGPAEVLVNVLAVGTRFAVFLLTAKADGNPPQRAVVR